MAVAVAPAVAAVAPRPVVAAAAIRSRPRRKPTARELAKAASAGGAAVEIGDQRIVPGAAGLGSDAVRNGLPVALIVVLALLALGGAAMAIPALRRGIPGLGRLPGLGRGS